MSANNSAGFQRSWRAILFAAALLLSPATYAQEASQNKDTARKKRQTLEVRLRTLTPAVCIGSSLKLELELTNIGQEIVELNKAYFWSNHSFCPFHPEDKERETECFMESVWPRSRSTDIFLLAPGVTHFEAKDWPLDEENMKAGQYTLEIGIYGTQNKVQVELFDCEPREIKE